MTLRFTADLHAWHRLHALHVERGFEPGHSRLMTEWLIENWNSVVTSKDETWILGDFAICSRRYAVEFLESLNGRKHLCVGNHDVKLARKADVRACFVSVNDTKDLKVRRPDLTEKLSVRGPTLRLWLSHYGHYHWPASHQGSIHLYGHSHGKSDLHHIRRRALDVGVDAFGRYPLTLDEIVEIILEREQQTS